jgi:hypothetical protein
MAIAIVNYRSVISDAIRLPADSREHILLISATNQFPTVNSIPNSYERLTNHVAA